MKHEMKQDEYNGVTVAGMSDYSEFSAVALTVHDGDGAHHHALSPSEARVLAAWLNEVADDEDNTSRQLQTNC